MNETSKLIALCTNTDIDYFAIDLKFLKNIWFYPNPCLRDGVSHAILHTGAVSFHAFNPTVSMVTSAALLSYTAWQNKHLNLVEGKARGTQSLQSATSQLCPNQSRTLDFKIWNRNSPQNLWCHSLIVKVSGPKINLRWEFVTFACLCH